MRGLAIRRHHDERVKRKVADYYHGWSKDPRYTEEERKRIVGLLSRTRKLCSCANCRSSAYMSDYIRHKRGGPDIAESMESEE